MSSQSAQILGKINQLISFIDDSGIQKTDKLKITKVLLALKLSILELLGKDIVIEAKVRHLASPVQSREGPQRASALYGASVAKTESKEVKISKKHELILEFIKNKGGEASSAELLGLGIAGRSLRRYLKNLSNSNKIKIEKSGRQHFYKLSP